MIALYEQLQRDATLRVAEVAAKHGVSVRQVQRDLDVLKEHLGHRLEQRPDGGWHIPREKKRAHDRRVALAQVLALELGAKLSEFLWGPARMEDIHARIDGLAKDLVTSDEQRLRGWRRRVAVIAPGQKNYAGRPEAGARLGKILQAMVEQRPLTLSYRSHRRALAGEPERRLRVHPLGIVFYRDGVYFIADVVAAPDGASADRVGARILLALDRIGDDVELGEAGGYHVPAGFDARAFFGDAFGIWRDGEARDEVVEVDDAHAPWVLERVFHPTQSVELRTDGSAVLRIRASGLQELSDWIVSLGEHGEVVEPAELREHVRQRLRAAAARYGEGGDIVCRPQPVRSSSVPHRRRKR